MALIRALLVPADGARALEAVDVELSYPEIPEAIGAQYFELLRSPVDPELMLVVDEEGFLTKRPSNIRASVYANCHLVGDVLVARDGGDDLASLTDADLEALGVTP